VEGRAMRVKKFLVLSLVLIMSMTMLLGCSNSDSKDNVGEGKKTENLRRKKS